MIKFSDVSFGYAGGESILNNLSFEIKKGEFAAIIGENGAGKSTTSKMINGLLKPSSGSVTVMGMDTAETKTSRLAKHAGFLFQNPDRQLCQNTVHNELRFSLDLVSEKSDSEKEERIEEVLEKFKLDGNSDPFKLSRGERQKAALASVLAAEPEILILDEPTTGLDYRECTDIMNAVKKLNKENNTTVIMVCHDMEIVLDYAERVLVMAGGKLLADGSAREIFRQPDVLEKASIVPPQIVGLALRLQGEFYGTDTVDDIIEILKGGRQ